MINNKKSVLTGRSAAAATLSEHSRLSNSKDPVKNFDPPKINKFYKAGRDYFFWSK